MATALPSRRPSTAGSSASYETARSSPPPDSMSSPFRFTNLVPASHLPGSTPDPSPSPPLPPRILHTDPPPHDLTSPSHATVTTTDDEGSSSQNRLKFQFPNPSDSSTLQSGVSTPPSSASTPKPMVDQMRLSSSLNASHQQPSHSARSDSVPPPHNRPLSCSILGTYPSHNWSHTPASSSVASASASLPYPPSRPAPSLRHVLKKPELRSVSATIPHHAGETESSMLRHPAATAAGRAPIASSRESGVRLDNSRQPSIPPFEPSRDYLFTGSNRSYQSRAKGRSFTTPSSAMIPAESICLPKMSQHEAADSNATSSTLPRLRPVKAESSKNTAPDRPQHSSNSQSPLAGWPSVQNVVQRFEGQAPNWPRRHSSLNTKPIMSKPPEEIPIRTTSNPDSTKRRRSLGTVHSNHHHRTVPSGADTSNGVPIGRAVPPTKSNTHKMPAHSRGLSDSGATENRRPRKSEGSSSRNSSCKLDQFYNGDTSEWQLLHMVTQLNGVQSAISMTERSSQQVAESGLQNNPMKSDVTAEVVSHIDGNGVTTHVHHYHHYHHHHHHHHIATQSLPLHRVSSDSSSKTELGHAVAVPIHHVSPPQSGDGADRPSSLLHEAYRTSEDEQFYDVQSPGESPEGVTVHRRTPSPQSGVRLSILPVSPQDLRSTKDHNHAGPTVTLVAAEDSVSPGPPIDANGVALSDGNVPVVAVIPPTPLSSLDGANTDTVASTRAPTPVPVIAVPTPEPAPAVQKEPTLAKKVRRYSDTLVRAIHPAASAFEKKFFSGKVRDRVVQVTNKALRKNRATSHGSHFSQEFSGPQDNHLHPDWIPRSERRRLMRLGVDPDYDCDFDPDLWTLPPGGDTSDVEDEDVEPSRLKTWSGRVRMAFARVRKDRERDVFRVEEKSDHVGSNPDRPHPEYFASTLHEPGVSDLEDCGVSLGREPDYPPDPGSSRGPALVAPSSSFYSHANNSSACANIIPPSAKSHSRDQVVDDRSYRDHVHRSDPEYNHYPSGVYAGSPSPGLPDSRSPSPSQVRVEFESAGFSPSPEAAPAPSVPMNRPSALPRPPIAGSSAVIVPWGESPAKPPTVPPPPGSVKPIPGPFSHSSGNSKMMFHTAAPPAPPAVHTVAAPSPPSIARSAPTPTGSYKFRSRHPPSAFVTRGFADSMGGGHGVALEPEPEETDPWLSMSMGLAGGVGLAESSHGMPIFGDEVLVGDGYPPFGHDSMFSDRIGDSGDGMGFGFGMYGDVGGFSGFSAQSPDSDDAPERMAGGVSVS